MPTLELVSITKNRSMGGGVEPGFTVEVRVIHPGVGISGDLSLLVTVPDQGDPNRTLEAARQKLAEFGRALEAAAEASLW